jgi:DNA-directed RNA polymerase specialized sigma24 family protein
MSVVPLTGTGFNRLLDFLDRDRELAGRKYETIQRKLVKFFEYGRCASPEELADTTIDRVTRRLVEGEEIRATDPSVYFYGVARNVAREFWSAHETRSAEQLPDRAVAQEPPDAEERFRCLDQCLERLAPVGRQLILEYYEGQGRHKIENRQRLATELQISQSALRLRAQRIREQLEKCVRRCVQTRNEPDTSSAPRPLQWRGRR